jgi:hypothetical protein
MEVSNSCNLKVMRLVDTSYYCGDETISNYLVEVLPVNKSTWVTFHVAKDFSLALNSSNLRYKKVSDASKLLELPDGIYEFKQSFKPNILTVAHFYHLRTTSIYIRLRAAWAALLDDKCDITREEFHVNRDKLREIDEYLLAAKYEVEECLDKTKGKELYDWADNLLQQYTNECKCL